MPKCNIVRNYDCKLYKSAKMIREGLINQLTNPVLFEQSVRIIRPDVPLIEVGFKKSLTAAVEETRQ